MNIPKMAVVKGVDRPIHLPKQDSFVFITRDVQWDKKAVRARNATIKYPFKIHKFNSARQVWSHSTEISTKFGATVDASLLDRTQDYIYLLPSKGCIHILDLKHNVLIISPITVPFRIFSALTICSDDMDTLLTFGYIRHHSTHMCPISLMYLCNAFMRMEYLMICWFKSVPEEDYTKEDQYAFINTDLLFS